MAPVVGERSQRQGRLEWDLPEVGRLGLMMQRAAARQPYYHTIGEIGRDIVGPKGQGMTWDLAAATSWRRSRRS